MSTIYVGGAAAHLHLLSEKSRRFFSGAIITSGTAANAWALTTNDQQIAQARHVADQLDGVKDRSVQELIEFYTTVNYNQLLSYSTLTFNHKDIFTTFAPTIES